MMTPRARVATRRDHENFCLTEGWNERKRATGKRGTHHVNYELPLPDGRILYTRISHPVDRTDYGPSLWKHILRDQLEVTDDEFWECVVRGVVPVRGRTPIEGEVIPVDVVRALVSRVGVPEREVMAMTKDEAVRRLMWFYTSGE